MLYKLKKLEFKDMIARSEVTSLLLYHNSDLVGYTHNTGWIAEKPFPENLDPDQETSDDFTLYYGEIFNWDMKQKNFFSWKKTVKGLYWLSIPSDFKVLSGVRNPGYQFRMKNKGYTLLIDHPVMKYEFDQVTEECEKSSRIKPEDCSIYSLSAI